MIEELDVRSLIPIKRHEKLLKLFSDIPAGESFVFINDHDPKPLYYEFRSIYGDVVDWVAPYDRNSQIGIICKEILIPGSFHFTAGNSSHDDSGCSQSATIRLRRDTGKRYNLVQHPKGVSGMAFDQRFLLC